jgi:predicted dehydrogenase
MLRIGVVGYGYWGPNLVRNFAELPDACVTAVADLNQDRLGLLKRRYPSIEATTDVQGVLNHPEVDAVAIATPVSIHFPLALAALQSGKHLLIEKPMTATSTQALRLIDEAERRKLVLMVDHTFVYTGAVRRIRQLIDEGALGEIYYYDSTRINLGLFQYDVDVIWDLAVHDLSIMEYIFPEPPVEISATGSKHVNGATEDIAYVTALYNGPLIAHLNVNWLSPVKVRRTLIGGSKQMIVYDDIEASEKLKIYNKGVCVNNGQDARHKLLVSYRSGDMYAPQLDLTEALHTMTSHFVNCIRNGGVPVTDGHAGLRVVRALEAATRSMRNHGAVERLMKLGIRKAAAIA